MSGRLRVALTPGPFDGRPAKFARPTDDGVALGALAPLADADVALFPFELGRVVRTPGDLDRLRSLVASNAQAGCRTVMYLVHDHVDPLEVGQPAAVVLRTSMLGSRAYRGEHSMPVNVIDPWEGRPVGWRSWTPVPRVSFMGQAGPIVPDFSDVAGARASDVPASDVPAPGVPSVLRTPVNIGRVLRSRALTGLSSSSAVTADVVVRDAYFGVYDADRRAAMRAAFDAQMRDSDYVLCVRGAGNFSIRLFETMAMGRVPVIVESDLVLPCADVVDWDGLSVRVPLADVDRVDVHVAAAHAQGPERFAARQRAAREAWEGWLRVDSFARYVATVILAGESGG